VRLDRLFLPVSKYAPSTMMAMMRYKAHNQYALTMNATSRIHFKGDIRHYSTVTRSVDLGIAGCFSCCYFFYIGGILSLPYQFYHHAHKMLCDHGQIFFFFLFDTDPHRSTLSECEYGSPRCATVYTMAYHLHCGLY
jgi:hypothetical protein